MSTSSIPRFKAALLSRLQALPALAGVQVSWGHPLPARLEGELVLIGDVASDADPVALGTGAREERYRLELTISVAGTSRMPHRTYEERAFVLAGVVESSIVAWRTEANPFAGAVAWAIPSVSAVSEGVSASGDARESKLLMIISCVARI